MKTAREDALDKKQIIAQLARSPHGALTEYLEVGTRAANEDPNFFAHLVAWNHVKGEIRDAKVALPIIALASRGVTNFVDRENGDIQETFVENALAHLADLNPRSLGKVVLPPFQYAKDPKDKKGKRLIRVKDANGKALELPEFCKEALAPTRIIRRLVHRYLRDLESDRRSFERTAVLHKYVLHELYAHWHAPRPVWVGEIMFHGEKGQPKVRPAAGSVFDLVSRLGNMTPEEAAGTIMKYRIPFIVARGALGKRASEPDQVMALINAMSPTELVTNMKWLESVGVKTNPALRAALEAALGKAAGSSKAPRATMKASKAAAVLEEEGESKLAGKLHVLQEKQLDKLGGIEGDWMILVDKSGSMQGSIEFGRQIAAVLARMVKGKVHLIFFDNVPYYIDVTGKTLEELTVLTRNVQAGGGTSMSVGIRGAMEKGLTADGIVFVGDGANHGYAVKPVFDKYCEKFGIEPTLYFFKLAGEADTFTRESLDIQTFDLIGQKVDYHSLPNLVQTMRVGRYQLLEEIMATPLATLDEVLKRTKGMPVLPKEMVTA